MELGAFSVSLNVKDIEASRQFYSKLGFQQVGGNQSDNWLIMRNGAHTIGLFQGMFDKNILTFNPGWDQECGELDDFTDVRDIQKTLKQAGLTMDVEADESSSGPASFIVSDPDGNPIMLDQHR